MTLLRALLLLRLRSAAGSFVGLSGGAPFSQTVEFPKGSYELEMWDSYGDGWNGATLTIGPTALGLAFTGPESGVKKPASKTESFNFPEEGTYAVTVSVGSYASELSWALRQITVSPTDSPTDSPTEYPKVFSIPISGSEAL